MSKILASAMLVEKGSSMSSKIRVLDEETVNKVVAGEVIENPLRRQRACGKSLDAESCEITFEIRGSLELIPDRKDLSLREIPEC